MKRIGLVCILGLLLFAVSGFIFATGQKTKEELAPVTIHYFSCWNEGEPYVSVFKQIIEEFEESHPGIKVKATWTGRDILTKLRTMLLTEEVPDIIEASTPSIYALAHEGLCYKLNDDLKTKAYGKDIPWIDTFKPGQIDPYMIGNDMYTIPWWVDTIVFFYNETIFSENNLTPPKTWDQLLNVCDTLKANGVAPFVVDGGIDAYNLMYLGMLIQRNLGDGALYEAFGDKTGKAWDNPGFLKAAQQLETLVERGYFLEGFEGYVFPAGQIDYVNGKAAMLLMYTWLPAETKDAAPEGFKFTSFPFPSVPGGKGKITDVVFYQLGFGILKDAPHKEEAVDFIKFFMQSKYMDKLTLEYDVITPLKGGAVPPNNADASAMMDNATASMVENDGVSRIDAYPEIYSKIYKKLDDELIFGKITAEEFIAKMKQEIIDYWKTKE